MEKSLQETADRRERDEASRARSHRPIAMARLRPVGTGPTIACTIQTYYRSKSGMKLGDTVDFELKDKPFWKEHRFRVSDAHFDSDEDLRIEVEGASPLLAMVVIASPAKTNSGPSNKASKGPTIE